jgi:CubicO group peptidase (beta-lactamase class C family)
VTTAASGVDPRIERVLHGLAPPVEVQGEEVHFELGAQMRKYRVPGVSVAVFEHGRIVWARGFGVADATSKDPVTETTLFQAASMSKPLNALAVLMSVARGELSLDAPINDELRDWKLPDSELARGAPVTLRRLLSHTAGTNEHGFLGYARGVPLPTLVQVLSGVPPANSLPIAVDHAPGEYRYSGGGITIAQLALVERVGLPYPKILARDVLAPLAMTHSTFEQPLPPAEVENAASGYAADGTVIAGRWHVFPEMAAAGLWTTPSDLAQFLMELGRARAGRSRVISKTIADEMTTAVADAGGPEWKIGLGPFLYDRNGAHLIEHDGETPGFESEELASLDGDFGIVVMTNSYGGQPLIAELERAVFAAYGWPGADRPVARVVLAPAQLAAMAGVYGTRAAPLVVELDHGRLAMHEPFAEPGELVPIGGDEVVALADASHYHLVAANRLAAPAPLSELEAGRAGAAAVALRELAASGELSEAAVNRYAYGVLHAGHARDAVAVFQLVVAVFPDSMNAYESLAEGYEAAHDPAHAIASYRDALAAEPRDTHAAAELKDELRATCTRAIARLAP